MKSYLILLLFVSLFLLGGCRAEDTPAADTTQVTAQPGTSEPPTAETSSAVQPSAPTEPPTETSLPPKEPTPLEAMLAGEVYVEADGGQVQVIIKASAKLARWYCDNMTDDWRSAELFYLRSGCYPFRETPSVNYAVYLARNKDGDEEYVSIVYASPSADSKKLYLVSAKTGLCDRFTFEDCADALAKHALFKDAGIKAERPMVSNGVSFADLSFITQDGRMIADIHKYSDSALAVVSYKREYYDFDTGPDDVNRFRGYCADMRVDLVSPEGKPLGQCGIPEISEQGWIVTGWTGLGRGDDKLGSLTLSFGVTQTSGADSDYRTLYADFTVAADYSMTCELSLLTNAERNEGTPFDKYAAGSAVSASGRFEAVRRDGDLLVRNTATGKETLIFDYNPNNEKEFEYNVQGFIGVGNSFFEGEELFFNYYGWESVFGSGRFDCETGKLTKYPNRMYLDKISDGCGYGGTSIMSSDFFYGRFTLDAPDEAPEKLITSAEELEYSRFFYSDDGKYVVQIVSRAGYYADPKSDGSSFVRVYDIEKAVPGVFKPKFEYAIASDIRSIEDAVALGDYIFLWCGDSFGYSIKFK